MTVEKKDWFLILGSVILVWAVDQGSKAWAVSQLGSLQWYGLLGLVKHYNPGAMLGMFSDLPPLLRVVSLSTGGAFIVFIYLAIQYLLPLRSMPLRIGMSFLLGGILGNVTDRIFVGSVVDFLVLGTPDFSTAAFNVADAVQWVGYFMIVATLILNGNQLWPESNIRKKVWVNLNFQMKYVGILIAIGFCFSLIFAVFSFTYLKLIIDELVIGPAHLAEERFITPYMITFSVICLAFLIALFLIGRILSHRMAGPLFAFERFLDDTISGHQRDFKLRAGDEFTHLEEIAHRFQEKWNELQRQVPEKTSDAEDSINIPENQSNESLHEEKSSLNTDKKKNATGWRG